MSSKASPNRFQGMMVLVAMGCQNQDITCRQKDTKDCLVTICLSKACHGLLWFAKYLLCSIVFVLEAIANLYWFSGLIATDNQQGGMVHSKGIGGIDRLIKNQNCGWFGIPITRGCTHEYAHKCQRSQDTRQCEIHQPNQLIVCDAFVSGCYCFSLLVPADLH